MYEYECQKCGKHFDVEQRMTDDPLKIHDECGGNVVKVFSSAGIVLKGSGFYKTDARSGSGKSKVAAKKDSDSSSPSPEKKSDADSATSKPTEKAAPSASQSGSGSSSSSSSQTPKSDK